MTEQDRKNELSGERYLISSNSTFEAKIGYSRAVVDGDWVFVSGTTGYDYATMTISENIVVQAEQCFQNIEFTLAQVNCTLKDVVRVRYIFPDRTDFEPCWPVFQRYLGDIRPAATMIVAGLAEPQMKLEVEVTARRHRGEIAL